MSETSPGNSSSGLPHRGTNSNNSTTHCMTGRVAGYSSLSSSSTGPFAGRNIPAFPSQDGLDSSVEPMPLPIPTTGVTAVVGAASSFQPTTSACSLNNNSNLVPLFSTTTTTTQRSSFCDISSHHTFSQSHIYQHLSSRNNNSNSNNGNHNFLDLCSFTH